MSRSLSLATKKGQPDTITCNYAWESQACRRVCNVASCNNPCLSGEIYLHIKTL